MTASYVMISLFSSALASNSVKYLHDSKKLLAADQLENYKKKCRTLNNGMNRGRN